MSHECILLYNRFDGTFVQQKWNEQIEIIMCSIIIINENKTDDDEKSSPKRKRVKDFLFEKETKPTNQPQQTTTNFWKRCFMKWCRTNRTPNKINKLAEMYFLFCSIQIDLIDSDEWVTVFDSFYSVGYS